MLYVALLRGINVGGKNVITMADLKKAFTDHGFSNVQTYIQSGNVIFHSEETDTEKITKTIEAFLEKTFQYAARIVVISQKDLHRVLDAMPPRWKTDDLRCYIAFVRPPLTPSHITAEIKINPEVDFMDEGPGVVYMGTYQSGLTKSGFTKLIGTKVYQEITMRNLNTVQKIEQLLTNI